MRAGYFISAEHRAWTRPFGDNRHLGDRLIRDPIEANLRIYAHLLLNPVVRADSIVIDDEPVKLADVLDLRPEAPDFKDKIVGFGLPDIELSSDVLASIKCPEFWVALEKAQDMANAYGEAPAKLIKDFLHEHGRTTADALTNGRVLIAAGLFALHLTDIDAETKQRIAKTLVAIGYATDAMDGYSARGHKDGATKEGGAKDQDYDKLLEASADLFALLPMGTISKLDAYLSIGRNVGLTLLRRPFKARGIDTKSVQSGKISTAAKAGAQLFGLFVGERYPNANKKIQRVATGLKIVSAAHAPYVWIEQHELKQHNLNDPTTVRFLEELVS